MNDSGYFIAPLQVHHYSESIKEPPCSVNGRFLCQIYLW